LPLTEATIEPTPAEPAPAATPSPSAPPPTANDEEEISLARLADDGGPPPPEADRREIALAPTSAEPEAPPAPMAIPAAAPSLEKRVRRLEDALAQLQEQQGIETRIVARPPASPPTAPATPASTTALFDAGKRLLGAVTHPAANAAGSRATSSPSAGSGGILWLLWDTWAEARAIVRMFLDPRYHLPWSSRVIPIVLLVLILTSKYWMPGSSIPFLGDWLLVKLVDLLLAFLLFKWLGHEARRYRQTSPDLPPTLRL
jgi:hypothetical protein